MTEHSTTEPLFRREYARLVSTLSGQVGIDHLETIEDAVQSALLTAVEHWPRSGKPDNPAAWLYRVAYNQLMSDLRHVRHRSQPFTDQTEAALAPDTEPNKTRLTGEIQDEELRMLFVCCDPSIPAESRLVMALKILCGFNVREIAIRLFMSEAHVYKRLQRGRERLRQTPQPLVDITPEHYSPRLGDVQRVLYLLFTEGYLSSRVETSVRRELCEESARLTHRLEGHPIGQTTTTMALLALMHLQLARLSARQDGTGGLLLLEEQDRDQLDKHQLQEGLAWLARSASGDDFSRYHAEAGIVAEHALAPTYEATRWDRIAGHYAHLEHLAPAPLHRLNRAVAVAEWQGPQAGLALLTGYHAPAWLTQSYLWEAVLGDLHSRCGNVDQARIHQETALRTAPNETTKKLLGRRFTRYRSNWRNTPPNPLA